MQLSQKHCFSNVSEHNEQGAWKIQRSPGSRGGVLCQQALHRARGLHTSAALSLSGSAQMQKQRCKQHRPALHAPGACKSDALEPEITCPNLWMPAADTRLPRTLTGDTFFREAREVSARKRPGSPRVRLHAKSLGRPGSLLPRLRGASSTHVQVLCVSHPTQQKIVMLSLSNCFSATGLEAEDGSKGEFLAKVHLSNRASGLRISVTFPTLGRAPLCPRTGTQE